jgi:hypothetical protein
VPVRRMRMGVWGWCGSEVRLSDVMGGCEWVMRVGWRRAHMTLALSSSSFGLWSTDSG